MAARPRLYHSLYFRVIAGIVAGVALGSSYPAAGEMMKPLGDGFIKLIRMMIAPVIFLTRSRSAPSSSRKTAGTASGSKR